MISSKVKAKIRNKELMIEAMLRVPDAAVAEIMCRSGVDLVMIDTEHFAFEDSQIAAVVNAVKRCGKESIVRVSKIDHEQIGKMLDLGTDGILAPQIDSYEEAMRVVEAVKYAPIGKRGFCPFSKAAHFGVDTQAKTYAQEANDNTIIALLIESKAGVEDLDRILSIPEVDEIHIGVSDLSHSYGMPSDYDNPRLKAIVDGVMKKVAASGKALTITTYSGLFCTAADAGSFAAEGAANGATTMQIPCDLQVLATGYRDIIQTVREVCI